MKEIIISSTNTHRGLKPQRVDGKIVPHGAFYRAVGTRIARRRLEQGISQSELGKMVKCSRSQICNIECGIYGTSLHRFAEIARVLKCPIAKLLP